MSGASRASASRGARPYRMKDLCDLTGLPRQAIHFYIQQGLVPEGHKTGRNMAYYDESHVERIKLIKQLQHEQFLPLKAIRAVLDERADAFSPAQRRLLEGVKHRLGGGLAPRVGQRETVDAKALMLHSGIDRKDFDDMEALGLFAVKAGPRGKLLIAKDDAWMLEVWGQMRALGFSRELGFAVRDLTIFEEAITKMFEKETAMLTTRLAERPPAEVAAMVEKALPLIHTFLVRYHETKVRNFFARL